MISSFNVMKYVNIDLLYVSYLHDYIGLDYIIIVSTYID